VLKQNPRVASSELGDILQREIHRFGELKRAIINMPPRSTESRFASVLFPAWYLGRHPKEMVMQCSHTAHSPSTSGATCAT
jgi:hypothetical protein